ncbi:putative ribonuclease H-like domain-containing protein [Tanacetum coccineum]|uniref:Ribonuclease H-like domain-containing protein n=1 Tax=Tanacetum coccineum TaxID=301880 RepID=A0ABQ5FDF2_9ASTR
MARKADLNNGWKNVQRVNKQNQFVPSAVLTRTGTIPVSTAKASSTKNFSTARQSFNRQTVLTSTTMKVNTVKPIVNRVRPANVFYKTYSPSSRPFKKTTVLRTDFLKQKFNTAKVNAVSTVGGKRETAVKPSAGCNWRPQRYHSGSKYNGGSSLRNCYTFKDPLGRLKPKQAWAHDWEQGLPLFNLNTLMVARPFGGSKCLESLVKNKVLFTDSECLVLSHEFKLPDENQGATTSESNKWHRRLGHVNFKNLNTLVKGNLVRGLPSKIFQNDHTCVACQKGKQHKASCKTKTIENQLNQKVKTIRCDNGTEFKNRDVIEFCGSKGIKREYSNARTPQQNGVAERKNRTLIEAARTMLADSFLPNTFWAEAVIIAFAGKSDEGFLVGYSLQSKAFRVYNLETKRVEENLHINFLENKPNIAGKGPTWLFDLDYLTDSMNYHPVRSENQANHLVGDSKNKEISQDCFVLPIWPSYSSKITPDLKTDEKRGGPREEEQAFMDELERLKRQEKEAHEEAEALRKQFAQETENLIIQEGAAKPSSTNIFSTVSTPAKASSTNLVNTVSIPVSTASHHEGLSISESNKS